MYQVDKSDKLTEILTKLFRKDKNRYESVMKKMYEVACSENIQHYKNLRAPKQHLKRVHLDSHFVLTFSVNENQKIVKFIDFQHHDSVY